MVTIFRMLHGQLFIFYLDFILLFVRERNEWRWGEQMKRSEINVISKSMNLVDVNSCWVNKKVHELLDRINVSLNSILLSFHCSNRTFYCWFIPSRKLGTRYIQHSVDIRTERNLNPMRNGSNIFPSSPWVVHLMYFISALPIPDLDVIGRERRGTRTR